MSHTSALLELVARLNPAIYDYIHPQGPVGPNGVVGQVARVAAELNPQPLPPRVRGQLASAQLAERLAELAVTSHAQSGNGGDVLLRVVDDWCGTHPRPFPWPWNWPWPPPPDPDPNPWLAAEMFATAALTLAAVGARFSPRADSGLRDAFSTSADRLATAAVAAMPGEIEKG